MTTTSAERYVMSGGRASRLAIKEGDLFLYTNELGQVAGHARTPCSGCTTATRAT